jgi:hypothetical protein
MDEGQAPGGHGGDRPPHAVPRAEMLIFLDRRKCGTSAEHGNQRQNGGVAHAFRGEDAPGDYARLEKP